MASESPLVSLQPGPIAELCINRPQALNALNEVVLQQLDAALARLEAAPPRALVIFGGGERAFVAGADIAAMRHFDAATAERFAAAGQQIFTRLEHLPLPTVAAVQGFALGGGCELALCCDLVVAGRRAQFGQPEVGLGLLPGFGGTARLPRKIGGAAAARLMLLGEPIAAQTAMALGWVTEIFEEAELLGGARRLAQKLAQRSPSAVRAAKALLLAQHDLAPALLRERRAFGELFATGDAQEGTAAFVERRQPAFANF